MEKIATINDDLEIIPRSQKDKTDLEIFIEKYQPSKFKRLKNGIEVRSVHDLTVAMNKARETIKEYGLALVVVDDAKMAEYRAFEILEGN